MNGSSEPDAAVTMPLVRTENESSKWNSTSSTPYIADCALQTQNEDVFYCNTQMAENRCQQVIHQTHSFLSQFCCKDTALLFRATESSPFPVVKNIQGANSAIAESNGISMDKLFLMLVCHFKQIWFGFGTLFWAAVNKSQPH